MSPDETKSTRCVQCGLPVRGQFCSNCGSPAPEHAAAAELGEDTKQDPLPTTIPAEVTTTAVTSPNPTTSVPAEDPHDPATPEKARIETGRRWLWWLLGLVGAAAIVGAGWALGTMVGGDTETTTTTSTTTTTTTEPAVVDPAVSLRREAAEIGDVQKSEVVETPTGTVGVVAIADENSIEGGAVRLFHLEDDTWIPDYVFQFEQPVDDWEIQDLTGDGAPDILITLLGDPADRSSSVVLTEDGADSWYLAPFIQPFAASGSEVIAATTAEDLLATYSWQDGTFVDLAIGEGE